MRESLRARRQGWHRKSQSAGKREGGFTMSDFKLSEKEAATLIGALESYLPDLATERVGTDDRKWHAELKEKEAILGEILNRLRDVEF